MGRRTLALGIESSCDDTSAAVVDEEGLVLSLCSSSNPSSHAPFGGVIPEFAARDHLSAIEPCVRSALERASILNPEREIDLICVTAGPGLMGCLLVGVMFAKALAQAWGKPVMAVNHLEGHVFSAMLDGGRASPPLLALVASGGHTELYHVVSWGHYVLLGRTRDDAVGEAFDKVGKTLGLGFPGGPAVDAMAQRGNPLAFDLPIPLKGDEGLDFSYSGLKTAVALKARELRERGALDERSVSDLCASFQERAISHLVDRLLRASVRTGVRRVLVCGGVAANSSLRRALSGLGQLEVILPPLKYCSDNAAMVALAGINAYMRGERSPISFAPDPSALLGVARR